MKTASICTISHGTLRSVDLFEAFYAELQSLCSGDDCKELLAECEKMESRLQSLSDSEDGDTDAEELQDSEELSELVNELQDSLNECAPEFCYFGAHPGDGSDFGFWPDHDAMDEMVRCGEMLECSDIPEFIRIVSDHGNVSVYRITATPILEIV